MVRRTGHAVVGLVAAIGMVAAGVAEAEEQAVNRELHADVGMFSRTKPSPNVSLSDSTTVDAGLDVEFLEGGPMPQTAGEMLGTRNQEAYSSAFGWLDWLDLNSLSNTTASSSGSSGSNAPVGAVSTGPGPSGGAGGSGPGNSGPAGGGSGSSVKDETVGGGKGATDADQ